MASLNQENTQNVSVSNNGNGDHRWSLIILVCAALVAIVILEITDSIDLIPPKD